MSGGILLLVLFGACGGPGERSPSVVQRAVPSSLSAASWMVQAAVPPGLGAFTGAEGWQAWYRRDYSAALAAFSGDSRMLGRIHAELSALYRQALLVAARAIVQTYGEGERQDADPPEVDYLLGVSYAVLGQPRLAASLLGRQGHSKVQGLAEADAAWARRVAAGFRFQLSDDPALFPLDPVRPGELVEAPAAPQYRFIETGSGLEVPEADPTVLLQLAAWHERAARQALAGDAGLVDGFLAPWRLPSEASAPPALSDPDLELRFLGAWCTWGDLALAGQLAAGTAPDDVVSGRSSDSPYAAVLGGCGGAAGLDVDCVLREASALRHQLQDGMRAAAGAPSADHRMLSRIAEAGAVRAGARLADAAGDRRAAGLLRINALDRSVEAAYDPVFLLSVAAWDAGNRNPARAEDLLHQQAGRAPALDGARYALDALHLRVSREAGAGMPMH